MTIVSRRHWVFAAAALLGACQHASPPPDPGPPQQVLTGSTFNLHSPLVFPAGGSELLFQNEQIVTTAARLSRAMPYCRLTPDSGAPREIPPGRLTVGAVSYDERDIGTTSGMTGVTRIALAAQAGKPGYTLSCGSPAGGPVRGFLNADQIFNAIGGQFSMDLLR